MWNRELTSFLCSIGYQQCKKDVCIFIYTTNTNNQIITGIFVDDIISAYNKIDEDEYNRVKLLIKNKYQTTDIGKAVHVLGMQITYDDTNKNIMIDQET